MKEAVEVLIRGYTGFRINDLGPFVITAVTWARMVQSVKMTGYKLEDKCSILRRSRIFYLCHDAQTHFKAHTASYPVVTRNRAAGA
jgi:hypothetical protein